MSIASTRVTANGVDLQATKWVCQPRNRFDAQVEFWVAREHQWLPVRIRITQVNGNFIDLNLIGQAPLPPLPASKLWLKTTQGNEDEHSLLTLFVCLAAGAPKKTLLTEKTAASLVRKIRKSGWTPELAAQFIRDNAPGIYQSDYLTLWTGFVQDATKTLTSDMDYQMHDALALLRRECSVVG